MKLMRIQILKRRKKEKEGAIVGERSAKLRKKIFWETTTPSAPAAPAGVYLEGLFQSRGRGGWSGS